MTERGAKPPADRLVTALGGGDGGRIYLLTGGVKRWILSPDVFVAHGWRFADVETMAVDELDAVPTSPVVIGAPPAYEACHAARLRVSAPFLSGHGIEIGAGMNPQRLPAKATCELFELRDRAELARIENSTRDGLLRPEDVPAARPLEEIGERFPGGADFLVAHQVLEHCAEPIGTLMTWSGHVRTGGVLVLSVPHREFCPDAGRLVPDLEHLVLDHLLGRDADAFESREHAYSCAAGWMNFWEDWLSMDRRTLAERMHGLAAMRGLDVHWHAFTPRLFAELLQVTSLLVPRPLGLLAWSDPHGDGEDATVGDILAVLRVGGRRPDDPAPAWRASDVVPRLRALAARLAAAAGRIDGF